MISSLLPEHHRQGREHALVFSVEASLNFLSRPYGYQGIEKLPEMQGKGIGFRVAMRQASAGPYQIHPRGGWMI
jgi:hypothetical protein